VGDVPTSVYDSAFESAWLKWAQAIVHAQSLEADIAIWADNDPDPVGAFRTEYHAKRHGFAVVVEDVAPMPVRWRLLLGDIANNYRAALDHLAWTLVGRGRMPPGSGRLTRKQEKAVYFPICEDRESFNAEIRVPDNPKMRLKLPAIRRADAAIARRAQPYHRGPTKRPMDPFVLLTAINTGDKHRTIQPLWAYPSRIDIEVTHMRNCVLRGTEVWKRRGDPLDNEAEIAFLPARRLGPDPELEMQLRVSSTPTIGNRISVREWHAKTGIAIFRLLREFSQQPASIHEIGATWAELPPQPAAT
jgi:hypothetical protein